MQWDRHTHTLVETWSFVWCLWAVSGDMRSLYPCFHYSHTAATQIPPHKHVALCSCTTKCPTSHKRGQTDFDMHGGNNTNKDKTQTTTTKHLTFIQYITIYFMLFMLCILFNTLLYTVMFSKAFCIDKKDV